MTTMLILLYTTLALGLTALTLAGALSLADRGRALLHRTVIDIIEIMSRFYQARIDRDRQRAELDRQQDRHAARLEAWQARARLRLAGHRQQLIAGEEDR